MATANPAFNDAVLSGLDYEETRGRVMTYEGTAIKTSVLLAILLVTAVYTWSLVQGIQIVPGVQPQVPRLVVTLLMSGMIGGLVFFFITWLAPRASPYTSPIYAACEGLVLGGISGIFDLRYPGIAVQAVGITSGILFSLLVLYGARILQATDKFTRCVLAATGGIAVVYILDMVLRFFGVGIPYIHETGLIGIGFSLFVVVIAALNLVLDFDFIERGVRHAAPKYMEWYAGFGLLVTLIWLYIEVLRLLSKLRR